MPAYAWTALGVFIVAVGGGIATAVTSGLRTWRTLRRSRRALVRAIDDVLHSVTQAQTRAGRLSAAATRLARVQAQLQRSLAAAAVIAAAAGDARPALRLLAFLRR